MSSVNTYKMRFISVSYVMKFLLTRDALKCNWTRFKFQTLSNTFSSVVNANTRKTKGVFESFELATQPIRKTSLLFCSHIRQGYPLNLSISISGGKETNRDSPSNGE